VSEQKEAPKGGFVRVLNRYPRLAGVALMLLGALLMTWDGLTVLHAISGVARPPVLDISRMALAGGLMLMALGAIGVVLGARVAAVFEATRYRRLRDVGLVVLLAGLAIGGDMWLTDALQKVGYTPPKGTGRLWVLSKGEPPIP
jgi:hypothetical protein